MLRHSLGKFFSLCTFEICHVSGHISCTFSLPFTALRIGFVLSHVQIVGRATTSFFGLFFFGMNSGALSVSSLWGLQPPKHLSGLSAVWGCSLIMGTPETGHNTLDMALCYGERDNDIFLFANQSLAVAAQHLLRLYHCMGTLVCVHIVLCHEPTELLFVQLLPILSGWREENALALIVELGDIPFGQGIAMVAHLALFSFY